MLKGIVLSLLIGLPSLALAQSSVWKVSIGNNILFLGGTIHVLAPSDYPIPPAFDHAYELADTIVLETDLAALNSPDFQAQVLQELMYPGSESIADHVSADTLRTLDDFLSSRGIPLQLLVKFKPGMLTTTLTILELQRLGLAGAGVDAYFDKKAQTDEKDRLALETVEQQLKFLSDLGQSNTDRFLNYTLEQLEDLPELLQKMKQAWRVGDTDQLDSLIVSQMAQKFPLVYENLITVRNRAWLPEIEFLLYSSPVEFVLVGAAHMAGKDGLLEALRKKGYTVEQVVPSGT